MKAWKLLFTALRFVGFGGIGILFIYIEWTYLRQNFSDLYNPSMHFVAALKMLASPLFWVLLVIAVAGYFGTVRLNLWIEKQLREEWGKTEKDRQ